MNWNISSLMGFARTLVVIFAFAFLQSIYSTGVRGDDQSTNSGRALDHDWRSAIIDTLIVKLEELYVYPDTAKKMVSCIREKQSVHAYDSFTVLSDFVYTLTSDVLSVFPDGHFEISVLRETENEMRAEESEGEWWQRRTRKAQYNNFYFRKLEWLYGNIGYLDFREFEYPELSGETAVAVMQFLAYTDAIIIDLRQNPGGRSELSQLLLSYFFEDHRVHYSTDEDHGKEVNKQWWTIPFVQGRRKPETPLFVLTSRGTGSAAEGFTYALKHLNRAIVVGDTTAGAAHKTHRHIFPALGIEIYMPDGRSYSPLTKQDWEGVGVIPHVAVAPDKAFDLAYAMAIDTLYRKESDQNRRFRLEWVKRDLDAKLNPNKLGEKTTREFLGQYGPRKIFWEKGSLFYQREGRSKYQLIPLGDDWFKLKGLDYFRILFDRDSSGKVTGLIGVYDDGSRDPTPRTGK